jgi:hypothetical protein
MPSFRLFLLVAFLAAIVLAAPAPVRKRTIQKRSFTVPRQLNTAHPTGPNGAAAMRKVFRKYNFKVNEDFVVKEGFIGQAKQSGQDEQQNATATAASAGNTAGQSGSVAANPEDNAALFLSPVSVGGQTLNLDFDSGSSDL